MYLHSEDTRPLLKCVSLIFKTVFVFFMKIYIYIYIYILFAPVISTSIHHSVKNSHDIKVLVKVIKTETLNGFTSR